MRRGVNSFVDRHTTESVEELTGTVSRNSRTLGDEHPPHDFSAAVSAGGEYSLVEEVTSL